MHAFFGFVAIALWAAALLVAVDVILGLLMAKLFAGGPRQEFPSDYRDKEFASIPGATVFRMCETCGESPADFRDLEAGHVCSECSEIMQSL